MLPPSRCKIVLCWISIFSLLFGQTVALAGNYQTYRSAPSYVWQAMTFEPDTGLALAADGDVNALFDRNTTSAFTPMAPALVEVNFDQSTPIDTLRVYGGADYTLTVQAEVDGQWSLVSGLDDLNLVDLSQEWHVFVPAEQIETTAIQLQINPLGEAAAGIHELAFWSGGVPVMVSAGDLVSLLDEGVAVPHARRYDAAPTTAVIGSNGEMHLDDPTDNQFSFYLGYHPNEIKQAYLSYQLTGLSHWSQAIRTINQQPAYGGFIIEAQTERTQQLERINPAWLQQGSNTVRFVPLVDGPSYQIDNLAVIIELADGAHFIRQMAVNFLDEQAPIAALYDGDLTTGVSLNLNNETVETTLWQREGQLPDDELANSLEAYADPVIVLEFDRHIALTQLGFYLAESAHFQLNVAVRVDGVWQLSSATLADVAPHAAGWHDLLLPVQHQAEALRLIFYKSEEDLNEPVQINEIRAAGAEIGASDRPLLTVTYPDSGQYYDDQVYLHGYATENNEAGGWPEIKAADQSLTVIEGEFEGWVSLSDTDQPMVTVQADYPNGARATVHVPLYAEQLAQNSAIRINAGDSSLGDSAETDDGIPPASDTEDGLAEQSLLATVGSPTYLSLGEASLFIEADTLSQETELRVLTLRDRDLPALDPGMTNVTRNAKGFRFLPHGMRFNKQVKIQLPYDKSKLPADMGVTDINIYYHDEEQGRWIALEREAIDVSSDVITSFSDHFTDMIAAVVQVPKSPLAASFNATQIKGIKAANPAARVNLIDAPVANNQGDARLSYPIEVPPGRLGMQPQLAVQYNSSGGNGWMGQGWDLSMMAITVDTRWGVPRYDATEETETYLLNGQQLTPVAHRDVLQARVAEKIFHTRIEGEFFKIIRHGNQPNNYWWEVFDKLGSRYIYGSDDEIGPTVDATLMDEFGNVALWSLSLIQDSNGNQIRYRCERVSHTGLSGGTVPGQELYLKSVHYTGHTSTGDGPFEVQFIRDRDLDDFSERTDITIDARYGFKKVTADRLNRINVTYEGALIRAYEFNYAEGAFHKTLLQSVTQLDADGAVFNTHTFDYYDEARDETGAYLGFTGSTSWDTGDDGVDGGLIIGGDYDDASALSGTAGDSVGGHLYVGFNFSSPSKQNSLGGKIGFNSAEAEGLLVLMDINGDGLQDKVFRRDSTSTVFYRANQSGPEGGTVFAAPVAVDTLPEISREQTNMFSGGAELFFGAGLFFTGFNASNTITVTSSYFHDVNGDGLPDLVTGNTVLFNHVDASGVPEFTTNSNDTPYPIGSGAVDTANLAIDLQALFDQQEEQFPLLDTVKRWVAPFDGDIQITGDVTLVEDTSSERGAYGTADGVRIVVQHNAGELWSTTIAADDYTPKTPTGLTSIAVSKGDIVYFRVQSVFDGAYDQVQWTPEVDYLDVVTPAPDANGLDAYRYAAEEDFILVGVPGPRRAHAL